MSKLKMNQILSKKKLNKNALLFPNNLIFLLKIKIKNIIF